MLFKCYITLFLFNFETIKRIYPSKKGVNRLMSHIADVDPSLTYADFIQHYLLIMLIIP
jgi:hypothetical protein